MANNPYSNPYTNNPYANNPFSNNPYKNNPYSKIPYPNPHTNNPYTNNPYANNPYANNPYEIDKETSQTQASPFSDYKDTETLNSIADIIWNSGINNPHRTDNETFKFLNNSVIRDIPILNLVGTALDLVDHVYRHTIIPIQQGNPTALLMNTLQDLGETMDILANPIKGMVIETYHKGPVGLVKGLYKGSVGRVNYDYDTGNFIFDFALELVSDPFNWVSFGASSGLKTLASASTDALQEAAELTIKQGGKVLLNNAIDITTDAGKIQLKNLIKNVTYDTVDDFAKKGIDLTTAFKRYGAGIFSEEFMQNAVEIQLRNLNKLDSTSFFIKKGLVGIARTTEKIESYLFRAAAWSSLIPTPYIIKHLKNATPIANTLDVLSDHIYKTSQIITGVEDPLHVKYIEHTLNNKDNIQKAFNEFQDFIKIEDRIPLVDIEEAFRGVAANKLLQLKTILKETNDLTNRVSLYEALLVLMPADEGKLLKKLINDEEALIKELNKLNYKGDNIYACIKSIYNSNMRSISKINRQYEEAFSDVYKAYAKQRKEFFVFLDEAQALEQSKELLKQVSEKDPGIQRYLAQIRVEYLKNSDNYNKIINDYPDFLYNLKTQQDDLYFKLRQVIRSVFNENETILLRSDKTALLKNIQQHQDYLLKAIRIYKLNIDVEAIKAYGKTLKDLVTKNETGSLKEILDFMTNTYDSFKAIYQEAIHFKSIEDFSKAFLNEDLQKVTKNLPKYRATKNSVDKAINETSSTLKYLDEIKLDIAQHEDVVARYIDNFKEQIQGVLQMDKAFLSFDSDTVLQKHLNNVQRIYDTADLDKLLLKIKPEIHTLINDLTYLSNKIDVFINKTIPDLIDHYSKANSFKEARKRLSGVTDRKVMLEARALDKALKTSRTNSKIFSDLAELSTKNLTMLGDGTKVASITALTKADLDIVDEDDVNTFLTTLFGYKRNPNKSFKNLNKDLEFILNNFSEIIDGAEDYFNSIQEIINSFKTHYKILKQNIDVGQHESLVRHKKFEILSNIETLKKNLYTIKSVIDNSDIKRTKEITVLKSDGTPAITFKEDSYVAKNSLKSEDLINIKKQYDKYGLEWSDEEDFVFSKFIPMTYTIVDEDYKNLAMQFQKAINNVLGYISKFKEGRSKNKLIYLSAGDNLYITSINKAATLKEVYQDSTGIKPLIHELHDVDGVYFKTFKAMQKLAIDSGNESLIQAYKAVTDFFDRYQAVEGFITDLYLDRTFGDSIANRLFDSTTKYDDVTIKELSKNLDYHVNKIFDNADIGRQSADRGIELSIDALVKNLWADIKKGNFNDKNMQYVWETFTKEEKELFERIGEFGETHNALDDVRATELYLRLTDEEGYFYSEVFDGQSDELAFANSYGGFVSIMDLETTGTETGSAFITEFAMKSVGNEKHTINLRLELSDDWFPPAPGVITTKFPNMDEAIARQKFKDFHTKALNPDPNIEWVTLEGMADRIARHFNSSAVKVNDTIIGHNIKSFDLRVIQNFLDYVNTRHGTHYYLPANPTSYTFIDSYQDMLNKQVPSLFTAKMKNAFKQHLSNMIETLDPNTNSHSVFKPVNIFESIAIIELDKILTSSIDMSKPYEFSDIMNCLKQLKGKIDDFINLHTGAEYKESQLLFTKSITQTEEGITLYKNNLQSSLTELQKRLDTKKLTKLQRKEINEQIALIERLLLAAESSEVPYVNIQMLMNSYRASESITSYINIGNTSIINNFFKYDEFIKQFPKGITQKLINNLNDISKTMNNIVSSLRKVSTIYDNKDLIQKTLQVLNKVLSDKDPLFFKYLRTSDQDPRYMFAELTYIYNKFVSEEIPFRTILVNELGTEQTEEILNLLNKGLKPLQGDWKDYDFIDDKIDYFMKRTLDGPDIAVKNYINRAEAWTNLIDKDLRKFTAVANAPGIVTARTDMIASQAEPMERFLNTMKDKLNKSDKITQKAYMQSLLDCSDYINITKIEQLIDLNPQDLLNILCFQSMFIGFDAGFVNKYNSNIIQKLLNKKEEWLQYGIEFDFNKLSGDIYIFPNESVTFNSYVDTATNTVKYILNNNEVELYKLDDVDFGKLFDEALKKNNINDPELAKQFFEVQKSINKVSNYEATGTSYEMVNKKFFESLPKQLPTSVLNKITKSDFINEYLFKDRPRFNMTFLGSNTFRKKFSSSAKSDIVAAMMNTFSSTVKNATERFHYIEYVLNSGYDLNLLAEKCKDLGELRKTLENHPNFVLGVCMKNDKGVEVLRRLTLNTEVDFERAKKFGAKIYDEHIFSKLESIINAKSWDDSNPFLNFYTKAIRLYKQGYLFSTGFFVRNVIDTFMRNIALSGGNVPETVKQTYRAIKLYTAYNDTVKTLTDLVKDNSGILNRDTINYYFKYYPDKFSISKDEFDFAHSLLNEGAFMGEVRAWKDYKAFMKEVKESDVVFENTKEYADAYDLFVSQQVYKRFFGTLNEDVENIQRLAGYLSLQEQGIPFTRAIYNLKASHFDYGNKTDLERMMELVIPFYSFKVKNLHYWLDSLERHGWLANVMTDFMTPIWNFDEYDQYELENNRSLQYNIKTGNVVFDNNLTFKLNPSIMDALQLVTDPVGSIGNSMFVGLQLLTDTAGTVALQNAGTKTKEFMESYLNVNAFNEMQPKELLQYALNLVPYGAAVTRLINGIQYAQDIKNPLPAAVPSLFGRVNRYTPYTPKTYNKNNYYKANAKRQSYSKNAYKKKLYSRKTYPRKIYKKYSKPYDKSYPINFKNIYIDGMYSVPNVSTYTAHANRYYHFSRLPHLPTVSIYDKLYNSRGKPRWDAMLQTVTPQNLKYVIKNTIHYK